jgi:16S rRNA (adenine1518-N6/adenine1519-N6)-dimethyltransferase
MDNIRAKKHLGQHFLHDDNTAQKIVDALVSKCNTVVEVGPGMGVLTKKLILKDIPSFFVVEIDPESVEYLKENIPQLTPNILEADFLKLDLSSITDSNLAIIGNFPYNISSQIMFKVLEHRNIVDEVVGMFQKEVAQRIACKPGTKAYGILSVLIQAWYNVEYLYTVSRGVFAPPPKVESGVIRVTRNKTISLPCDESLFVKVVKAGFNQRRKTLNNSLKVLGLGTISLPEKFAKERPEQLSVADFVELTQFIENIKF